MAERTTTGLYEEDLYCSNPNNLITNELQTLQVPAVDEYYFIIPHAAPFYVETLEVRNHHTGALYHEGTDYVVGHRFIDAMKSLKRPIAGSIRFLRRNITGIVRLKYHTVGGQWGYNSAAILEELSAKMINPITRSWDQIEGFPVRFPTIAHDQSVDRLVGSEQIRDSIERIGDVLEAAAAGSTEQHVNDRNNPHRVNATQVGLGAVMNYGIASLNEALNDTINNKYMTPMTVNHAILKKAIEPLNNFIARRDNPNQVNKEQIGLSRVPNLALATDIEAIDPLNNQAFMSPYTTALMVQSIIPLGQIDSIEQTLNNFISRRDNPHQVTAVQVGTLTTDEIHELVQQAGGGGGGDAATLNGYTLEQIRTFFAAADDPIAVADSLITILTTSRENLTSIISSDVDGMTVDEINTIRDSRVITRVEAGGGGYLAGTPSGTIIAKTIMDYPLVGLNPGFNRRVVINYPDVYFIAENGGVVGLGDSPEVYNDFNGEYINFDPINAVTQLVSTKTARYMLVNDGRLVRSTGPANMQVIDTDVSSVWCNREHIEERELVVYRKGDDLLSYGDNLLVTAFLNIKNKWITEGIVDKIHDLTIGYNHILAMFTTTVLVDDGDGELIEETAYMVKVYELDHDNDEMPVEIVTNIVSPIAISGSYGHSCVLTASGKAHFFGDLPACEDEITAVITSISCGDNFTVFVDEDGSVEFWGDDPQNRLICDYVPDYEVTDDTDS